MATEFDERRDAAAHAAFERWKAEHAAGFVVNRLTEHDGMIHFADCGHLKFDVADNVSLAKKPKLASLDAVDVLLDAAARGLIVRACTSCRPSAHR